MASLAPDPASGARPVSATLGVEVRQSLSLIGMTALTMLASIGIGVLAGHLG
jgi:hypothetical protein